MPSKTPDSGKGAEAPRSPLAERMELAHLHLRAQLGGRKVPYAELAERVSAAHGERTFTAGQVSEYQKTVEPPRDVIAAYAIACDVDPGWLAFGELSKAPAPPIALTMRVAERSRRKRNRES